MLVPSSRESPAGRFALYIAELREFFASSHVRCGSRENLAPFAARLAAGGRFREDMAAMTRSILYRESESLPRAELLELIAVAVGGGEVDAADGAADGGAEEEARGATGEILEFLNAVFRSRQGGFAEGARLRESFEADLPIESDGEKIGGIAESTLNAEAAAATTDAARVAAAVEWGAESRAGIERADLETGGEPDGIYARAQRLDQQQRAEAREEDGAGGADGHGDESGSESGDESFYVRRDEGGQESRGGRWPEPGSNLRSFPPSAGARDDGSFDQADDEVMGLAPAPLRGRWLLAGGLIVVAGLLGLMVAHRGAAPRKMAAAAAVRPAVAAIVSPAPPQTSAAEPSPEEWPQLDSADVAPGAATERQDEAAAPRRARRRGKAGAEKVEEQAAVAPSDVPVATQATDGQASHERAMIKQSAPASVGPPRAQPTTQRVTDTRRGLIAMSSGLMSSHIVSAPAPTYPRLASLAHVQGQVVLQAVVSSEGRVIATRVLSGHRLLRGAATHAVQQWRYQPYRVDGRATDITTIVTVDFRLNH